MSQGSVAQHEAYVTLDVRLCDCEKKKKAYVTGVGGCVVAWWLADDSSRPEVGQARL